MENNNSGISNTLVHEILEDVKLLLDINKPTDKEELIKYQRKITIITLYINAICTNILIKTNRRIFVPELKYIVIDLVVDKFSVKNELDGDIQSIQSMSEAGRSVTFGASAILQNKINLIVQKQLQENDIIINKYKLLYKT